MTALSDLRVVELAGQFTGVGGRLLAELGADVVVVEPPDGSPERRRPPFAGDRNEPDRSLRWWSANAGKRGVTLDADTASGRERLAALIATADIVVEGRLPSEHGGVEYERCRRGHEGLIWVSITPFGLTSSRSAEPVTDLTMLAGGGPLWNCGYDDHSLPPIRGAGDQAANVAGLYTAIGCLVALAHRDQTSQGQRVDVNLNAALNVTAEQATYQWLVTRDICQRQTGRHAFPIPSSPVQIKCADGRYATTGVLPRKPAEFAEIHRWLAELGLLDELPEAFFLQLGAERESAVDLSAIGTDDEATAILAAARDALSLIASRLPADEFYVASQRRGFPTGAVRSPDEAFEDEQVRYRGFQVAVEHPELSTTHRYPGTPYAFSATPTAPPTRPPLLGEHNALLSELP